jgi:hypothetical protein
MERVAFGICLNSRDYERCCASREFLAHDGEEPVLIDDSRCPALPPLASADMGYGNRDKPERQSGRVGFVEGRLNELRRRWENAKGQREKNEVSEQIREWQLFRPERSAPGSDRR